MEIARSRTARRWGWLLALVSFVGGSGAAFAQAEQQELVTAAEQTLTNFLNDPEMGWLQQNIGHAKGVLIAPKLAKAGFIVGGSGGRAVLFARDAQTGQWIGPAFYNLATASVGFLAGISVSETLALVMSDKGLNSLLTDSVKLGPDASFAVGPLGAGAKSDILADFVAYSRSGFPRRAEPKAPSSASADTWNNSYYGQKLLPPDILARASAHNAQADRLVAGAGDAPPALGIELIGPTDRRCADPPRAPRAAADFIVRGELVNRR
jgi:lipid-binding SYLF domain-containing protein